MATCEPPSVQTEPAKDVEADQSALLRGPTVSETEGISRPRYNVYDVKKVLG